MLTLLALSLPTSALEPRTPLVPPPVRAVPLPDGQVAAGWRLTVKFVDEVHARAAGPLRLAQGTPRAELDRVIAAHGLEFSPLIRAPVGALQAIEARAEERSGVAAPDLAGILSVSLEDQSPEGLEAAGEALQQLDLVEYAFIQVLGAPPPGDIAPSTPDYSGRQGYRAADPGIDADGAADLGLTGASVRLSDCEYGWETTHEDLMDRDLHLEAGQTIPSWVADYGWDSHGTAAIGEVASVVNGYGCSGLAAGAEVWTWPEYTEEEESRRVSAITNAIAASEPGDVVMLEMQTIVRPGGDYCPAEVDPNVWTVVQVGTAAGVVVVGAAGNGDEDLDSSWYQANYLAWGDSGAILVGAGSADTRHQPLYFTTHGARIDLQGWGELVFTLGYGDFATLGGDQHQAYTSQFSGTSSATPIVVGACLLVQDYAVQVSGSPLDPLELRALLADTGVPQGSGVAIGPLPDVTAAVDELDSDADGFLDDAYGGDDCDDEAALAHPGAEEIWYDGIDEDCLGGEDLDLDGDGYDAVQAGGDDCDDADPDVHPGAQDVWYDGVDTDCDGASDADADGDGHDSDQHGGDDCDDTDATVYPGAGDPVDGLDNDCDGQIDEGGGPDTGLDADTGEGPGKRGCGCTQAGTGFGWFGLLGLPLLLWRRRARSEGGTKRL